MYSGRSFAPSAVPWPGLSSCGMHVAPPIAAECPLLQWKTQESLLSPAPFLPLFPVIPVVVPAKPKYDFVELWSKAAPEAEPSKPAEVKDKRENGEDKKSEDTPENAEGEEAWRKLIDGKSYRSRNVCKSLIRSIYAYIRKNREDIVRILSDANYSMKTIDSAFGEIGSHIERERQRRGQKASQSTIKNMLIKKSIFTYIIRETLHAVLIKWDHSDYGKISHANIAVYKDSCASFYQQAVHVLAQPAQGTSFNL